MAFIGFWRCFCRDGGKCGNHAARIEAPVKTILISGKISRCVLRTDGATRSSDGALDVAEADIHPLELGSTMRREARPRVIAVCVMPALARLVKQARPSLITSHPGSKVLGAVAESWRRRESVKAAYRGGVRRLHSPLKERYALPELSPIFGDGLMGQAAANLA